MKLYEINEEIRKLTEGIEIDEETGEVLGDVDAICEQMNALQMEKEEILGYLAKLVLNNKSDITELKAEEARLKARRQTLEKKTQRLIDVIDRECDGKKTSLGVATVSYRRTSKLNVFDTMKAVRWLKRNKLTSCFRVPDPEIMKADVKKLISSGTFVPGCEIIEDYSCTIK